MRFHSLRKHIAAVALEKKVGCKGPLVGYCHDGDIPKWCSWCRAKSKPLKRGKTPFKDFAHTTDTVMVGLCNDSSGYCKGPPSLVNSTCEESENLRDLWCSYCKAKYPAIS